MKVRLLTRWNGYLSNDIVSLSDARAEMLEKEGIGRIVDRPQPEPRAEVGAEAPQPETKAKKK